MPNDDFHRKVEANTARTTRPILSATVLEVLDDVLRGGPDGQGPGRLNTSVFSFDILAGLRDMSSRDFPRLIDSWDTYIMVMRVFGPKA